MLICSVATISWLHVVLAAAQLDLIRSPTAVSDYVMKHGMTLLVACLPSELEICEVRDNHFRQKEKGPILAWFASNIPPVIVKILFPSVKIKY